MGGFSIWHILILAIILLLLFGGKGKVSDLMGDFAKGIKSFKKNMAEPDDASMEASAETGTIGPIEMFGRPGKMFTPRFGQRKWNWLRGSSPSRCIVVPPPSRVGPCWLERRPSVESA